jgi:hypothetical protein
MQLLQRLAEEASCGRGISLGGEQEIDCLSRCVDGAVEINPIALHPNVCLVYAPRSIRLPQMRTDALVEFGCVRLDPAKEGRGVHLNAAVSQHAFQIAIANRELQVPADRPEDELSRELPTLERVLALLLHRQPLSTPLVVAQATEAFKAATEPHKPTLLYLCVSVVYQETEKKCQ